MAVLRAASNRLGSYELGERLGAGGMAEVYVARRAGPRGFHKKFAIKRILPQLSRDSRFVAMFCDEARICAALTHPNIVQVVDFGESDGELFMAMEFVDGVSVAKLLRSVAARGERFPLPVALFIAHEVLRALSFAHDARDDQGRSLGIVHRDVSPGNVLIGRAGEVKLTDFGIVRASFIDRRTYPGELKGKLGYMSPEQVIGAEIDRRSDLFTAGIVLAEMLLARPLFPGRNELEILTRIYDADLRVLERYGVDLPVDVLAALRSALARDPDARCQSAGDFADALRMAAQAAGATLADSELVPWLSTLGILPSQSGVREAATGVGLPPPQVLRSDALPRAPDLPPLRPARPRLEVGPIAPRPVPRCELPTVPPSDPPAPGVDYHLRARNGALLGPLSELSVRELIATGRIDPDAMLSQDGGPFRVLRTFERLAALAQRPAFRFADPLRLRAAWRRGLERGRLPAVLYDLALGEHTGLLVAREGHRQKRIYFEGGAPRFVASTERGELLGVRLIQSGLASQADVDRALEFASERNLRLGEVLVTRATLRPMTLLRALTEQLEARFAELLSWSQGDLFFVRGELCGEDPPRSPVSALDLVTRALRESYSDGEIAALLGPLRAAPILRSKTARCSVRVLGVDARELAALQRAPGAPSIERLVADLAQEGIAPAHATLRGLFIGLSCGLITVPGFLVR